MSSNPSYGLAKGLSKLRLRVSDVNKCNESHVKYTGSHVTLHRVFVRGYAQFDTLPPPHLLLVEV